MGDSISVITAKVCNTCRQVKDLSMFNKDKKSPDGYRYDCKLCARNRYKDYYQENKEKILAKSKSYDQENKNRCKETYVLSKLLAGAKTRAKAKGLPFDLTMEWLESMVISYCPITLGPIDWTRDQVVDGKVGPNSPSIDKIIPEFGYVQSNCAIISHRANAIKNNGTIDEHRRVVQYMAAQQLRDTEF